jgi:hypothetical protein
LLLPRTLVNEGDLSRVREVLRVPKKGAGFAGLIVISIGLLTGCGAASSVSSAASSIAASVTAGRSSGAAAPATSAPAADTSTPATTAPATSAPPTTSAPTTPEATAQPTRTIIVTAPATSPATPAATATPTSSSSGFPWTWFWIAVAIAAVVGLISWLIVARRRRARSATDWQGQVIDAYAKGSALHDAMAAAETPGALAADNAGLRWSDIQRRADDYSQLLYRMQQTAPNDQERLRIADLIASLQAARSAMDAERSGGIPDGSVTGLVRDRLGYFAYALNSLRQPDAYPAGPPGPAGPAGPV